MVNETEVVMFLVGGPVILMILIGVWWFLGMELFRKSILKAFAKGVDLKEFIPKLYDRWKWINLNIFAWPTILLVFFSFWLQPENSPLYTPVVVVWVLVIIIVAAGFNSYTRLQRHKALTGMLDLMLERGQARELDGIAPGYLEIGESRIQAHAMEVMLSWGSPDSLAALQRIRSGYHSTMPPVFYSGLRRLVFDLHQASPEDLPSMLRLTRHTRFWRVMAEEFSSQAESPKLVALKEMAEDESDLVGFYVHNQMLVEAYPNVFCTKSRERAVLKDLNYIQAVMSPEGEFNQGIVAGTQQVIGQIAGEKDGQLEGDRYYLQLWSQEEKAVAPAEVDILEILPEADDWAVVAVLDKMGEMHEKRAFTIKVIGEPDLSENTRRIIEQYGG